MQEKDDCLFVTESLEKIRSEKLWMNEARYFQHAQISVTAAKKMLSHAVWGVDNPTELKQPREIMGLMFGKPTKKSIVVTDVFSLPIEGTETRVIAEDDDVMQYMIRLSESLEKTRKERLIGWYHSHPFDKNSSLNEEKKGNHCFLSQMDVTTQTMWQRVEDNLGNPFLAVVVDPQNSIRRRVPEFGAFRVVTMEENSGLTPLGEEMTKVDESEVERQFGSCWKSYYQLKISFFTSNISQTVKFEDDWKIIFNGLKRKKTVEEEKEVNQQLDAILALLKAVRTAKLWRDGQTSQDILKELEEKINILETNEKVDQVIAKLTQLPQ
eukprot:snap_masked-scaffold_6-processed-gene-9.24-mRNA-1 protein AED:0.07 eAED:0.07 QI:0/-1/0/1/-1/1/1/0/324